MLFPQMVEDFKQNFEIEIRRLGHPLGYLYTRSTEDSTNFNQLQGSIQLHQLQLHYILFGSDQFFLKNKTQQEILSNWSVLMKEEEQLGDAHQKATGQKKNPGFLPFMNVGKTPQELRSTVISNSVTPSIVVSRGKRNKNKKNKTRLHMGGFPWAGVREFVRVVQACMNPPVNPPKENNGYLTTGYSGPNNGPPMTSPNAAGAQIYNRRVTAEIPVTAALNTELFPIYSRPPPLCTYPLPKTTQGSELGPDPEEMNTLCEEIYTLAAIPIPASRQYLQHR